MQNFDSLKYWERSIEMVKILRTAYQIALKQPEPNPTGLTKSSLFTKLTELSVSFISLLL